MELDPLFAEGGALCAEDPRYEPRPQQRAMAEAVARALESGESLVVEAPTGVGKSLGYLLPALLWAVSGDRRVIVSTYTRALQEQILGKDLPLALKALARLGLTARGAMLQGADNYLCVQRLERLARDPELFEGPHGRAVGKLAAWAKAAETGHRSAIPFLVPQGVWGRVARDPQICLGPSGRFWSQCLYRRDRERAERAHVVIINHALLLSAARLPPFDALIIDEAHNLEEAASVHFAVSVSRARLSGLLEDAKPLLADYPVLEKAGALTLAKFQSFLEATAKAQGLAGPQEDSGGTLLEKAGPPPPPSLLALEALLAENAAAGTGEKEAELKLLHGRLAALRADLSHILAGDEPAVARWVEWTHAGVELRSAPLEVGDKLAATVFGRDIPVVLTSATLAAGEGLKGFRRRVGLAAARDLALDSPFDYRSQAALLVRDGLPVPSESEDYLDAVARHCAEIVARVPGGVFLLFSSWRALKGVHLRLKKKVKGRPLWVQGESGNEELLEEFAKVRNAVLLGVDTFWQGVDVSGGALSCVVLTKLPFPSIGSPVEEARRRWFCEMGREYFADYSLPKAVMKFRQGFGRLIRSSTDRGAVVALDSRLLHRGYGKAFLEALPSCRRLSSYEELAAFLKGGEA